LERVAGRREARRVRVGPTGDVGEAVAGGVRERRDTAARSSGAIPQDGRIDQGTLPRLGRIEFRHEGGKRTPTPLRDKRLKGKLRREVPRVSVAGHVN